VVSGFRNDARDAAWLFADDSVKPVMPSPGSLWNLRMLVWFAPRPDCRLQVVDRLAEGARQD
jgi:hypothetical protein